LLDVELISPLEYSLALEKTRHPDGK